MSILILLLVWFPSYILSLNLFLRKAHTAMADSANGVTVNSGTGGWLARLGWGLGEASVQVLEASPLETYEARIAFFGHAIPEEGLTGWLVPLDSIVGPCPSTPSTSTPLAIPTITRNTPSPFMALDNSYVYENIVDEEDNGGLEEIENTGCRPLCPLSDASSALDEPWYPFPNTSWIALVRRGSCSFADKALYAQALGATSLIVGGLDESLISMSASGNSGGRIEIPSVFVGARSYANLTRLVTDSEVSIGVEDDTTITIAEQQEPGRKSAALARQVPTILIRLEGEPPWEWYTPILSLLLVLSLPSLLTLCTLLIHRLRAERRERELRAPEDIVKGLPIRVWTGRAWEKDLERGRGRVIEDSGNSESSPLLPIGHSLNEDERDMHGYGSTLDPEPSTSAPRAARPPALTSRDRPQADLDDKEIIYEEEPSTRSPIPLPPSPTQPLSVPSAQHTHEDSTQSDETIPRPPWFTSQSECAICLCDFEIGDRVRVLPCGHVFHLEEVDPWLIKQRRVCPVCKYDVTNPPTALVPASSSPPNLSDLAAITTSDAAAMNTETTAESSPHVSTHPIADSDSSDTRPTPSDTNAQPGAEFTLGQGTAAQLLNDVDGRRSTGRGGWLGTWLARGRRRDGDEEEEDG